MTREEKIQIAATLTAGLSASGRPLAVTPVDQFMDFLATLGEKEEEIDMILNDA
ncbi:hypothetical protein ACTL6U_04600 [Rhodovibrionaceae bacterium A322]